MAIPNAVRKIGEAAEQAAIDAGMKGVPGSQPVVDANGNPATPLPEGTPIVSHAPVQQTATVTSIEPDAAKYEQLERQHRNYKASTDQTIFDLRQQKSQDQQTIAGLQAEIEKLKAAPPVAYVQPTPESFEEGLQQWLALIPKEERDQYSDEFWRTQYITKTTPAPGEKVFDTSRLEALENEVNQSKQYQEKTQFQMYLDSMDAAFPNDAWIKMTEDPAWEDFCGQRVSRYSSEIYGQVVNKSKGHDATTLISVLKDFQQHLNALKSNAQPANNTLLGQVTPDGGAGGSGMDDINANVRSFTQSEVTQFYQDVATTKKYTPEQAADIENQIKAANLAGKIYVG